MDTFIIGLKIKYLAEGGFGIVYKAKWIDGHGISIKINGIEM
jgi:hypothetical protein